MSYENLLLEKKDYIATITINRPEKMNAVRIWEFPEQMISLLRELGRDDDVRAIILTGAGKVFCAGADLDDFLETSSRDDIGPRELREMCRNFNYVTVEMRNLEKPIIAAVNGVAVGAGAAMTMAADIRIASEKARFGWVFIRRGLTCADMGATYLLPRIIGLSRATELLLTGDIIDAEEALRIGYVNRVVPHDQLMSASMEMAKKLAQNPPLGIACTKIALNRGQASSLEMEIEYEAHAQAVLFHTEDHKEGVKSFLEKREARFQGR